MNNNTQAAIWKSEDVQFIAEYPIAVCDCPAPACIEPISTHAESIPEIIAPIRKRPNEIDVKRNFFGLDLR